MLIYNVPLYVMLYIIAIIMPLGHKIQTWPFGDKTSFFLNKVLFSILKNLSIRISYTLVLSTSVFWLALTSTKLFTLMFYVRKTWWYLLLCHQPFNFLRDWGCAFFLSDLIFHTDRKSLFTWKIRDFSPNFTEISYWKLQSKILFNFFIF